MSLFWRIERSRPGGDVALYHITRHKCGEEEKLGGGPDPIGVEIGASQKLPPKLADKKGREGGSIGLGGRRFAGEFLLA